MANEHISQFLTYYFELPYAPHYAVLLNGKWGTGKTFIVKRFLDQYFKDGDKTFIYVSLFGLSSPDEIDDAIFQELYPLLSAKAVKIGGRIGRNVLKKFTGIDLEGAKLADVLEKIKVKFFVFDDLERAEMETQQVLGYLNQFVEHEDVRMVVISNEDEIEDSEDYRRKKEKVIGKTLIVNSEFDEAIEVFLQEIKEDHVREYLDANKEQVKDLFSKADAGNLRILRHSLWDFERLMLTLNQKVIQSPNLIQLMRFYLALSIEFKLGSITVGDLRTRKMKTFFRLGSKKDGAEDDDFEKANSKYPNVDFCDPLLSNQTLENCIANGLFDVDAINRDVLQHVMFRENELEKPWQTIWHFYERDPDQIVAANEAITKQIESLEQMEMGEILHTHSCRVFLAKNQLIDGLIVEDVVHAAKDHISGLAKKGLLKPQIPESRSEHIETGFGGLGYMEARSEEFGRILQFLTQKRQEVFEQSLDTLAIELLEQMKSTTDVFCERIGNHGGEIALDRISVLAKLQPRQFLECYDAISAKDQHRVRRALRERYEFASRMSFLAEESAWAAELKAILEARILDVGKIEALKLAGLVSALRPILNQVSS